MVFSSNVFLFLFLPLFLAAYYLTPLRLRSYTILLGSYAFYGWWRVDYLLLVFAISVWSYYASLQIAKATTPPRAKLWMILGIAGDLGSLVYFKYFNFLVENISAALTLSGGAPLELWKVILPIGISFHVFQSVSYVIDVYRKDAPPARHLVDFLAFTSLFPQLIAGPVLRYKDLADQFTSRVHSWALFNEGSRRFAIGFAKKVLIADTLAPLVSNMFALPNPTAAEAWLGALAYTLQLYFDFSAYSHMAIGLGLMMGFRFMENFNDPYISCSITEFWRRWHISLSTWLRDYLYIPLGGNRRGPVRTYINLVLTMVLGGIWHGANWTFVIWGAWHGGLMAIERYLGSKNAKGSVYPALLAWPLTMLFVVLGWVMFRAPDVHTALVFYAGMFGGNGWALSDAALWQVQQFLLATLVLAGLLAVGVPHWRARVGGHTVRYAPDWWLDRALPILFVLAVFKLSAQSYSPFLYFQF
jgi:alginate O-acetyltransferase complex protein AlgI